MKIINKTSLSYKEIGEMIDEIIKSSNGDTLYYGKIDYYQFKRYNIEQNKYDKYKVQIRYLKSYVEWVFYEEE